jgi:predicted protein tyrosine phosphatase
MNLLFVCSFGRDRSATAAALYDGQDGIKATHGGVHRHAKIPVTAAMVRAADTVIVFTRQHEWAVRRVFRGEIEGKAVLCLHIENRYARGSAELTHRIIQEMQRVLPGLSAPAGGEKGGAHVTR